MKNYNEKTTIIRDKVMALTSFMIKQEEGNSINQIFVPGSSKDKLKEIRQYKIIFKKYKLIYQKMKPIPPINVRLVL